MDRPIIFLDLDGVLNPHEFNSDAQSSTIDPGCVRNFNRLLWEVPDAGIVLSSAWRYMILNGAMTIRGFEYMLRTHGIHCVDRLVGLTCPDEDIPARGQQIRHWLNEHGGDRSYVVIDDGGQNKDGSFYDMGIVDAGHPVVWCHSKTGLTLDGAERASDILKGHRHGI